MLRSLIWWFSKKIFWEDIDTLGADAVLHEAKDNYGSVIVHCKEPNAQKYTTVQLCE